MYSTFTLQLCRTAVMKMKSGLRSRTAFNISIGSCMEFTCKGRVKQKNYNRNRKTHLELAGKCLLFPLCLYYSHRTDRTPFVTLIWKAERTEKALSCSKSNQAHSGDTTQHSFWFKNGPWMHKTLPPFLTPPDFKKFIQACFSKKHDINISL